MTRRRRLRYDRSRPARPAASRPSIVAAEQPQICRGYLPCTCSIGPLVYRIILGLYAKSQFWVETKGLSFRAGRDPPQGARAQPLRPEHGVRRRRPCAPVTPIAKTCPGLFDSGVVALERADRGGAVAGLGDALDRRRGGRRRRDVRDLVLDRRLADVGVVVTCSACRSGVLITSWISPFLIASTMFGRPSCILRISSALTPSCGQELARAFRRLDPEAELLELPGHLQSVLLVRVGHGDAAPCPARGSSGLAASCAL